ncbi:MAG: winged helix-turn-helix transcriptional regulator [Burkholderiaceae bacterium]
MAASTPSKSPALADVEDSFDAGSLGQALRRSHLAHAVDQITEPWSNMILRAAFLGTRQFESFQQLLGIPRQTLSLRLAYLVRLGVLRRQRRMPGSARHEYRLTPRGKDLYANVLASWLWDRRWGDPHAQIPPRLVHLSCQHSFKPQLVCEHCAEPLTLRAVQPCVPHVVRADVSQNARSRGRRWRIPAQPTNGDLAERDILAVIDDRWSLLIVAAIVLGAQRYDQLVEALGISNSVLARRLQRLRELELLEKLPDPFDARRSVYRLDKAGRALFPYLLTLASWASNESGRVDSIRWVHRACGKTAKGIMVCDHCHRPLLPNEVTLPGAAAHSMSPAAS